MSDHSRRRSDQLAHSSADYRDQHGDQFHYRDDYHQRSQHREQDWDRSYQDGYDDLEYQSRHADRPDIEAANTEPYFADEPLPEYDDSYQTPPAHYEEDVWLREKHNRITFSDADLEDISHARHSNLATTLAGFAGVVAMLGLIGFLALSSKPELSPQEIIAMEGYAGEQPTKTPFNLASLRDCEASDDCAEDQRTTVTPTVATTAGITPITTTSSTDARVWVSSNTDSDSGYTDAGYAEFTEIPAATNSFSTNGQIQVTSTDSDTPGGDTGFSDTVFEGGGTLEVLQQWSNVRSAPNIDGEILVSLAQGKTVTRLSEVGQWVEVEVDERGVIGYMHRSTVAPQ